VKNRQHHGHHISHPEKGKVSRFGYLGLVVAAFALMLLGKADIVAMERLRTLVTDAVAPVLDAVSRPVASVDQVVDQLTALSAVYDENTKLRAENSRLLEWQAVARNLSSENQRLKSLLNFAPGAEPSFVTARVIADSGGAFVHSVLLRAGSRDRVAKGQAVITGEGLVGRVQEVGVRSSRVLLITDLNSRIPVVVESTRARAILAGDNTDRPELINMAPGVTLNVGDRIVTSGHGGAFPPGIPVGMVARVSEAGVTIKPYVLRDRLEYVRAVDYGLQGILDLSSAAEGAGVSQ